MTHKKYEIDFIFFQDFLLDLDEQLMYCKSIDDVNTIAKKSCFG
jgi:hypothetical protein